MSDAEYLERMGVEGILDAVRTHVTKEKPDQVITSIIAFLSDTFAADGSRLDKDAGDSEEISVKSEEDQEDEETLRIRCASRGRRNAIFAEAIDEDTLHEPLADADSKKNSEEEERIELALQRNILFSHLDDDERQQIYEHMLERSVAAGTTLINQGWAHAHRPLYSGHNVDILQGRREISFTSSTPASAKCGSRKVGRSRYSCPPFLPGVLLENSR